MRFAAESEVLGSNGKSFSEDEEQDEVVEEDAILGFAGLAGEDAVAEEVMDEDIVQETSTRWHHGNGSRQALYDSVPGLGSVCPVFLCVRGLFYYLSASVTIFVGIFTVGLLLCPLLRMD